MVEANIRPHHFKWVLIKNRTYDHMRSFNGYAGFADIPQVDTDAANVKQGLIEMGQRELDIVIIEDADFNSFSNLINGLRAEIERNW